MARMSASEYASYLARKPQAIVEVEQAKEKPKRESELHRQITQEIRRRGWIACHGAMHKSTKRTLGEPDYHCLAPHGRHFMVEVKTPNGKLSDDQQRFIAQADQLGHPVYVVRSLVEFIQLANAYAQH
jgi:hypothetical protein